MKTKRGKTPSVETLKAEVDTLLREHPDDRVRLRKQVDRIYKYHPELLLQYAYGEPPERNDLES